MNAFGTAYPNAAVSGCYFHLCQSIQRKVNEVGLKVMYESNNEVRIVIRCLSALAYVPSGDVVEAFDLLSENKPGNDEDTSAKIDETLTFFEHTYARDLRCLRLRLRCLPLSCGTNVRPVVVRNVPQT